MTLIAYREEKIALSSVTYDGDIVTQIQQVYAILGTYYNKDLFSQAGIEGEPQTWDEFLEDCKKLKDAGIQPIVMGDKDQYVLQFGLYQLAANEIYSKNPDFDTSVKRRRCRASLMKAHGTRFLKCTRLCMMKATLMLPNLLDMAHLRQSQDFIDGKAAMTFDGSFQCYSSSGRRCRRGL